MEKISSILIIFTLYCGLFLTNTYSQGTWIQKADFAGIERAGAVGFSIGTKGYIGTGSDGTVRYNDFWEYDPISDSWAQKANFGGSARSFAVGFSIGTKGYIGTGYDGINKNDFWEYDQSTNSWTQITDFGGTARYKAVGFSIGTKGYIGTGEDDYSYKKDFWEWDQITNTWLQKADFAGIERAGAVGFSIGTKGYIGTGRSSYNHFTSFWEYDPSLNTWLQKASIPGDEREGAVGFSVGNKGYIGTGADFVYYGLWRYYKDLFEWDQTSNTWTEKTEMGGNERGYGCGFSIGEKVFIGTGVCIDDISFNDTIYKDFWVYTPPHCNETSLFTSCTGFINDGSGVDDYMNNTNCSWLIQPTGAPSITLTFTQFDTESKYDLVTVYDGSTTSSAILGSFHGNTLPPIVTSSGGSMLIVFTSDYSATKSGWEASYTCSTSVTTFCSGTTTLTTCTDSLNDGSGSNNYGDNSDCKWLIQPTGATSITLTFTQFDTERYYDFVTVYDGSTTSSAILGSFHGDSLPPIITSSGGTMLIVFTSDGSFTKSGWDANYSCSTISNTTITGIVKDAGINFSSGTLDFNNCNGCIVELYQGSSLISTQSTNSNGFYSFDNLTGTNYKIIGKKTGNNFTSQVAFDKINPGTNVNDLKIPFTLIQQANTLIDSLSTKTFSSTLFYNLVPISTEPKGYNETEIQNLLSGWQDIQSDYDDIVNSLSRLIIAQQALKEFSDDAATMTAEGIVSVYDFGESIVSLVTINKKIDNVISNKLKLIKKIKKYAISLTLKMFKFVVLQSWNYVQDPTLRANTKTHFQGIMDFLITHAASKDPNDFQESFTKDFVRDVITSRATPFIYEKIYVPLTQANVTSTYNNSATFDYTGSFTDAYNNVIHNINNNSLADISHQKTVQTVSIINNSRDISGFADKVGDLTQIAALATSFFDGGTLLTISTILKGIEVGASGFAMGSAFYRMYNITKEVPNATSQSFRKTGKDIRKSYSSQFLFTSSSNLADAIDNYNNHLYDIQNYIATGERKIAIAKMDSLIILDSLLQNVWMEAVTPIYAAAPYAIDVIANYDSLYNFTVIKNSGASMLYRQSINYNLIAYLLDSTSSDIIDSLNQNILNTVNANNQMDTSIQNMNAEILNIPIPAHITVLSSQYQKTMLKNSSYPVKIFYKNIGTINSDSVYAKITLQDGFTTINDSIYIGTIPVSETGNISFTINTPNYDTISYYTVVFNSPNTTSDGIGEALKIATTVATGNSVISKNNFTFFVYPNPSIGKFEIGNLKTKIGTIIIYNVLGEKIYQSENANLKSQFDISFQPSGIYFIHLKTEQGTMSSKFIIQK